MIWYRLTQTKNFSTTDMTVYPLLFGVIQFAFFVIQFQGYKVDRIKNILQLILST
jgi:hypothetical protein